MRAPNAMRVVKLARQRIAPLYQSTKLPTNPHTKSPSPPSGAGRGEGETVHGLNFTERIQYEATLTTQHREYPAARNTLHRDHRQKTSERESVKARITELEGSLSLITEAAESHKKLTLPGIVPRVKWLAVESANNVTQRLTSHSFRSALAVATLLAGIRDVETNPVCLFAPMRNVGHTRTPPRHQGWFDEVPRRHPLRQRTRPLILPLYRNIESGAVSGGSPVVIPRWKMLSRLVHAVSQILKPTSFRRPHLHPTGENHAVQETPPRRFSLQGCCRNGEVLYRSIGTKICARFGCGLCAVDRQIQPAYSYFL